jgi:hypothetical protein
MTFSSLLFFKKGLNDNSMKAIQLKPHIIISLFGHNLKIGVQGCQH